MLLTQNNKRQAIPLFRSLLVIIFIAWLTTVLTQYYWEDILQKPDIIVIQAPNNLVLEQLILPPIPELAVASQMPELQKQTEHPSNPNKTRHKPAPLQHTKRVKQLPATSTVNKQQVEHTYQQLSANGIDLQIAWPQDAGERQAVFDFIYQCVGVQFAVLNGETLTKLNHAKFDHISANQTKSSDYSDWIRVAQGSLSSKEQNWLQAFALTGTPIRLFPRHIDMRLAHYLANTLKGSPLGSLRANYQVIKQTLQLTNIHLNRQLITDNWLLYQGQC